MLTVHASYSLPQGVFYSYSKTAPLQSPLYRATQQPVSRWSEPTTKVTSGTHNVPLSAQATGNAPCAFHLKKSLANQRSVCVSRLSSAPDGQPMKISAAAFLSSDFDWQTKRRLRKSQRFVQWGDNMRFTPPAR